MDEKQAQVFTEINLEETRKSLAYMRASLSRIQSHANAVNSDDLSNRVLDIEAAIDAGLEKVWELQRKVANHVNA